MPLPAIPEFAVTPAPTPAARVRELLIDKFGRLQCQHTYTLIYPSGYMRLRCSDCGQETEGFRVWTPRGERP